jgi:hypothetical protein
MGYLYLDLSTTDFEEYATDSAMQAADGSALASGVTGYSLESGCYRFIPDDKFPAANDLTLTDGSGIWQRFDVQPVYVADDGTISGLNVNPIGCFRSKLYDKLSDTESCC